mgnify:CR=1 FL=1
MGFLDIILDKRRINGSREPMKKPAHDKKSVTQLAAKLIGKKKK